MKRIVVVCITIFIIFAIISTLLFFLLSYFLIDSPHNKFNEGLDLLAKKQDIYASDFEKVYLSNNYSISPEGNLISVTFKENNCKLICYYTQTKEFVDFKISGPPIFIDNTSYIFVQVIIALLAICVSILITIVLVYLSLFYISSKYPSFFKELSDKEQQFVLFLLSK